MNCQKCGNLVVAGDTFCRMCGAPITTENNFSSNSMMPSSGNQNTIGVMPSEANPKVPQNGDKKNKIVMILIGIVAVAAVATIILFLLKDKGEVVEAEGVNLYIPSGYTKNADMYGYDATYNNKDKSMWIGKLSYNDYGLSLDDWGSSFGQTYGKCNAPVKKTINGGTWLKMNCSDTYEYDTIFMGINDNKIHLVVIYTLDKKTNEFKEVEKQVESHLKFTK